MAFWNTIQFLFLWKHTQIIFTLLDLQMEVLEMRTVRTTLVLGTTQEEYHQSFDANIWQVWLSTRLPDSCVSEDESRPQCPPADAVVPMAAVLPASLPSVLLPTTIKQARAVSCCQQPASLWTRGHYRGLDPTVSLSAEQHFRFVGWILWRHSARLHIVVAAVLRVFFLFVATCSHLNLPSMQYRQ